MEMDSIMPVPHHVKERLRHQNLQAILEHVANSVPIAQYSKETKAKKLRRILLYAEFLQKEMLRLKLGTKVSSPGHELEIKSEECQVFNTEVPKTPGKAQIVFLKNLQNAGTIVKSETCDKLETRSESSFLQEGIDLKKLSISKNNEIPSEEAILKTLPKCDKITLPYSIVKPYLEQSSDNDTLPSDYKVVKSFRQSFPKFYKYPDHHETKRTRKRSAPDSIVVAKKSKPRRPDILHNDQADVLTKVKDPEDVVKVCSVTDSIPSCADTQPSDVSSMDSALIVSSNDWISSSESSFAKSSSQGSSYSLGLPSSCGSFNPVPFEDLYENFCDLEKEFNCKTPGGDTVLLQNPIEHADNKAYHPLNYNQMHPINVPVMCPSQFTPGHPMDYSTYHHSPSTYDSGDIMYWNNAYLWQGPPQYQNAPYIRDTRVPESGSYNLMCPLERDFPSSGSSTFVRVRQDIPDSLSESVALAMGLSNGLYSDNAF